MDGIRTNRGKYLRMLKESAFRFVTLKKYRINRNRKNVGNQVGISTLLIGCEVESSTPITESTAAQHY